MADAYLFFKKTSTGQISATEMDISGISLASLFHLCHVFLSHNVSIGFFFVFSFRTISLFVWLSFYCAVSLYDKMPSRLRLSLLLFLSQEANNSALPSQLTVGTEQGLFTLLRCWVLAQLSSSCFSQSSCLLTAHLGYVLQYQPQRQWDARYIQSNKSSIYLQGLLQEYNQGSMPNAAPPLPSIVPASACPVPWISQ